MAKKPDTGTPDTEEPKDFVEIGGSPVPGLTLRQILRGHTDQINRIAWSPDGKYLASPSDDKTIRIWDMSTGECVRTLEGHTDRVNCVTWSPDGNFLASASADSRIIIWLSNTWKKKKELTGYEHEIFCVSWSTDSKIIVSGSMASAETTFTAQDFNSGKFVKKLGEANWFRCLSFSPDGKFLASGENESPLRIWDVNSWDQIHKPQISPSFFINCVAWAPDRMLLASGGDNKLIQIWNSRFDSPIQILEGSTGSVIALSFSFDGIFFASKDLGNAIRIWRTDNWGLVSTITEKTSNYKAGLAFHPHLPLLATLGENDTIIRIWELDEAIILGQAKENVNYTTAKLVLVGDSGVGKTGLGWRLAHGEFKEHASTHGQQFWSIPQLNLKRKDGTDCEAVLWDLAGQHLYRQIHSIFLENVAAALVLFDPTNRQEPLKGVQFWLEQLKGKGQLPPTVLVGARVDRGAPALSQDELNQFCQRYGIKGGYISTSALKGDGLDELLEIVKAQIPWDEMTATVTTVTFKRIKDYVLSLKEKTDRKGVLVSLAQLAEQLHTLDPEWQFGDVEIMTAVGHLENHGYVTILYSSSGKQHILLVPELLVNVAASIMLLADKNPRELGAVSETELLQGTLAQSFDELKGLEKAEQQILIDAAILRFLEHNICFRDTFNDDTLLIFPSLIKQKRPLQDEVSAMDDISYVVRGRVENLYASLVVLLGYTPSFSRINQWQNQAQYEMDAGQVCGFRCIEEREGELELVLYYGDKMPPKGREKFQELFEQFLYQREVDVTRFPPAVCPQGHPLERNTFMSRMREGQKFVFCYQCDEKVPLPEMKPAPTIGLAASPWLQREKFMAELRSTYEKQLTNIKGYRRGRAMPRTYLSYLSEQKEWAKKLVHDLQDAGVYIVEKPEELKQEDFVIILNTSAYEKAYKNFSPALAKDLPAIRSRLDNSKKMLSLGCEGKMNHHDLKFCEHGNFCDETHYSVNLFNLVMELYAIPLTHAGFAPLRAALHGQWEQTLARRIVESDPLPAHPAPAPEPETEQYLDFDLHITPGGHAVASSIEGEAAAEISIQPPKDIQLALKLIQNNATEADLLQPFGISLYDWLFPGPIHTHLHQTEASARKEYAKLRLRLRAEPESIASLPLEFLYRETGGYYLSLNPDTIISRYLNLPLPPERIRRREGPLHMLLILSEPSDQGKFLPEKWEEMFRKALSSQLDSGQLSIEVVKRATRREIAAALKRRKPDIVQYVGHGEYKDGRGYILLVNEETGKSWPVTDEIFANLFMGHNDHLGLISLTACESAESSAPQAFVGVAPKLVERGTPAVIAMQYSVQIKSAKIFFEDFYASLSARKPVDWAVQSARNAVSQQFGLDNREFATPILYMRAKDGNLF